jgi:hypothetical protein
VTSIILGDPRSAMYGALIFAGFLTLYFLIRHRKVSTG